MTKGKQRQHAKTGYKPNASPDRADGAAATLLLLAIRGDLSSVSAAEALRDAETCDQPHDIATCRTALAVCLSKAGQHQESLYQLIVAHREATDCGQTGLQAFIDAALCDARAAQTTQR